MFVCVCVCVCGGGGGGRGDLGWGMVPYFFGYKTDFFSFQNNPKNLDPSYKTDLDHWDW